VIAPVELPPDIVVFERGWLSSNNVLLLGTETSALVDSGYWTHAAQTVALARSALGKRPLRTLANTHLHSDHCGGNAQVQAAFPGVRTLIPPGLVGHVREWNPVALTYVPTGQHCPVFKADDVLIPGRDVVLGARRWQIHAAPGHDPHSVVLFEPDIRVLISADALWANGFGVVFPELEGDRAFEDVAATFDLIESLDPRFVVPGHGAVFDDVSQALSLARGRLENFEKEPVKHARHAAKVLLKFKLLELQEVQLLELQAWAASTPYLVSLHRHWFNEHDLSTWLLNVIDDLVRSGAVRKQDSLVINM
jgi:glyoxylase-like metal-dependent hydrolase (beta-lactamase superfamily II)